MNWVVEYVDGNVYTSAELNWNKLPRGSKVVKVGVYDTDGIYHELENYDTYFFSDTATFSMNTLGFTWEKREIAGFHTEINEGKLISINVLRNITEESKVKYTDYKNKYKETSFLKGLNYAKA